MYWVISAKGGGGTTSQVILRQSCQEDSQWWPWSLGCTPDLLAGIFWNPLLWWIELMVNPSCLGLSLALVYWYSIASLWYRETSCVAGWAFLQLILSVRSTSSKVLQWFAMNPTKTFSLVAGFSSELLLTWTLPQELILTCLRWAGQKVGGRAEAGGDSDQSGPPAQRLQLWASCDKNSHPQATHLPTLVWLWVDWSDWQTTSCPNWTYRNQLQVSPIQKICNTFLSQDSQDRQINL